MTEFDVLLVVAAFFTSMLSGVVGLGGGTVLAALMFSVLPPASALPLHAFVQVFSNASRTLANFRDVRFSALATFMAATVPSVAIVAPWVVGVDPDWVRFVMGAFLLATFDGRWIARLGLTGNAGMIVAGGIAGGLGSVVGATGAMMAPFFFRPGWNRSTVVGTQAVCQGFAHVTKLIAFSAVGVSLVDDMSLAAAMVVAVIVGTFAGKALLDKLDDRLFRRIFVAVVFGLGVQLVLRAAYNLTKGG